MTAEVECCCPECGAEFSAEPGGAPLLLCGDSTVATDVERVLGGVEPHLMVTDPPYGVEYDPDWRNQAARNGATAGRARGVIGGRAIGKVDNDDRADWREARCHPSDRRHRCPVRPRPLASREGWPR